MHGDREQEDGQGRGLTNSSLSQLHGTEAQERHSIERHIQAVRVVGEGNQAVHAVCESRDLCLCDEIKVVPYDLLNGVEGHPHDGLPFIACSRREDHEHRLPARFDIVHPGEDHLRTAPGQHKRSVGLRIHLLERMKLYLVGT